MALFDKAAGLLILKTRLANLHLPNTLRSFGAGRDSSDRPAQNTSPLPARVYLKRFFAQRLPFEEHVRELASLKLAGCPHNAQILTQALDDHYGIQIRVASFNGPLHARGVTPETIHYHGGDSYTIWLPAGLSWWHWEYLSLHAISHVASGHLFIERDRESTELVGLLGNEPYRQRLARKAPLTTTTDPASFPDGYGPTLPDLLTLYEAEADLRARYYMRTAQLGSAALEKNRLNQLF